MPPPTTEKEKRRKKPKKKITKKNGFERFPLSVSFVFPISCQRYPIPPSPRERARDALISEIKTQKNQKTTNYTKKRLAFRVLPGGKGEGVGDCLRLCFSLVLLFASVTRLCLSAVASVTRFCFCCSAV
jgi:hypothetical protein